MTDHEPCPMPFTVTRQGTADLTHHQTRSTRFVTTSRGVRLASAQADDRQARWAAALLPLAEGVVLSHVAAAQAYRLPLPRALERDGRIHVTAPRQTPRPRRRDIVTHHAQLGPGDVVHVGALRITSPTRTFVDMAALLHHADLVALGDAALRIPDVTREGLLLVARARIRYPGRALAIRTVGWLDPAAASPRESHLRVLLRRAGLPRPEVNATITDAEGGFLAVGDLVFRAYRVIVEYDGEVHAPMAQRARDAHRRALLREHGWIVVEVVGADMWFPERVVARVAAALREGGR